MPRASAAALRRLSLLPLVLVGVCLWIVWAGAPSSSVSPPTMKSALLNQARRSVRPVGCPSRSSLGNRRNLVTGIGLSSLGLALASPMMTTSAQGAKVMAGEHDLLIIGCGTLGERIGRAWKAKNPSSTVVGETKGTSRHESFQKHGITPRLVDSEEAKQGEQYPFVVFSAPPSSSGDYVGAVRNAVAQWDKKGVLVFTSSGGAYAEEDGGIVTENSPTKDPEKNPRTKVLLDSEKAVLDADGTVVRLAGLYTLQRGAHSYWLQRGQVSGSPDGLINLIHYDDAAALVVSALSADDKARGRVFLGADDYPITRKQICEAALRHHSYKAKFQMPTFTGLVGPKGKKYDSHETREVLDWKPKFHSFGDFVDQLIFDEQMLVEQLKEEERAHEIAES